MSCLRLVGASALARLIADSIVTARCEGAAAAGAVAAPREATADPRRPAHAVVRGGRPPYAPPPSRS
ncbi:hypothetical protein SH611_01725 [Geminicoccaceae bacterium 1502E]|nr:hypothetical protein [Geminicoccaceae bacterium 1502E]